MKQAQKKHTASEKPNAAHGNLIRDYSNDPFFIKKDNDADAFLKKHGFPEELLKIKKGLL